MAARRGGGRRRRRGSRRAARRRPDARHAGPRLRPARHPPRAAHRRSGGRLRRRQDPRADGGDRCARWPSRRDRAGARDPADRPTPADAVPRRSPDAVVDDVARRVAVGALPDAARHRRGRRRRHQRRTGRRRGGLRRARVRCGRRAGRRRRRRGAAPAARRARPTRPRRLPRRGRRHGGRAAQRRRRPRRASAGRGADQRRLRRLASAGSPRCSRCSTPARPGVTVVNIDNGFGAGVLRRPGRPPMPRSASDRMSGWVDGSAAASAATCCSVRSSTSAPTSTCCRPPSTALARRAGPDLVPHQVTRPGSPRRVGVEVAPQRRQPHRRCRRAAHWSSERRPGRAVAGPVRWRVVRPARRRRGGVHGIDPERGALPRGRRRRRARRRRRRRAPRCTPSASTASACVADRARRRHGRVPQHGVLPVPVPAVLALLRAPAPRFGRARSTSSSHADRCRPARRARRRLRPLPAMTHRRVGVRRRRAAISPTGPTSLRLVASASPRSRAPATTTGRCSRPTSTTSTRGCGRRCSTRCWPPVRPTPG